MQCRNCKLLKQNDMKYLTTKSEITAKVLKKADCDYKGKRIGFNKSDKMYFHGSHFHPGITVFFTVKELKQVL